MMNIRRQKLQEHADLLEINKRLNDLTEQDITNALNTKLNVRIIELDQEEKLKSAAAELTAYLAEKKLHQVTISNHQSESITISIKEQDRSKVINSYNQYVEEIKKSPEYLNLGMKEKKEFDDKFKPKEEIINGQKAIKLTFKCREDAEKFVQSLRAQGIEFKIINSFQSSKKLTTQPEKVDASDSEHSHRPAMRSR